MLLIACARALRHARPARPRLTATYRQRVGASDEWWEGDWSEGAPKGDGVLRYATAEFMTDRGSVSAAMALDGVAPRYTEAELLADRYPGPAQRGSVLQYAATELKADRGFVLMLWRWMGFCCGTWPQG